MGADAIALVGDLTGPKPTAETLAALFKALGTGSLPSYHIPGPDDAPVVDYLREAYNVEQVYPFLHSVHGTFSIGPGHVVFAGMGGEIVDSTAWTREEVGRLLYEAWEAEYRLKVLQELKDPQLVVVRGPELRGETLGTSLVVAPGFLAQGSAALFDLRERRVERLVLA